MGSFEINSLLKALWGGHTAALQFMFGRQLQDSMDSRDSMGSMDSTDSMIQWIQWIQRNHGDIYTSDFEGTAGLTYLCDVASESRAHFQQHDDESPRQPALNQVTVQPDDDTR